MKKVVFSAVFFIAICSTAQTSSYILSEDVSISLKGGTLYGTLFTPAGIKKPPVVLIIAGSGPTDRDGNSILIPGKNNSLLQIADSLAKHGIASLRYDKRGIGKSKMENMKEDSILFLDGVNDAVAWYLYLQKKKYKKIFVAGHSEGSLVGMSVAAQQKVSGFISIAGAGRRIDDILKEQLTVLPDSLKNESYRNLDSLAAGKRIENPNKLLYSLFRPSVQPYMISWMKYDPQKIIQSLNCRVLIVQGTKDIQVKEGDAGNLYKARPSAQLLIIENMNHVLKEVKSDNKEDNLKAYSNPSLSVMPELISGIANFIKYKRKKP